MSGVYDCDQANGRRVLPDLGDSLMKGCELLLDRLGLGLEGGEFLIRFRWIRRSWLRLRSGSRTGESTARTHAASHAATAATAHPAAHASSHATATAAPHASSHTHATTSSHTHDIPSTPAHA